MFLRAFLKGIKLDPIPGEGFGIFMLMPGMEKIMDVSEKPCFRGSRMDKTLSPALFRYIFTNVVVYPAFRRYCCKSHLIIL